MDKNCTTCYHNYHGKHTNNLCPHTLMCHEHDKWIPCTNGDYLRNVMTDADIAQYMCNRQDGCRGCGVYELCEQDGDGFIKWLNKPTTGGLL